ncbi:MAG: TIM-barrel domain-containing protein, partial [Fervidobacterium sp.]
SILDPGVKVENGYEIFEKAKGKYFLKDKNGEDFEGAVWPGRVRFPDFRATKVRRWWSKNARKYLEEGIDGFWNDMNEIAIFATEKDLREARKWLKSASLEDGINLASTLGKIGEIGRKGHGDEIFHIDGIPHWKVRNTYGLNMTRATSELIQKQLKKRPFLITRSAYSGIQRYGGVWTGDNHSWWEHILQEVIRINSLSLSGVFYSGFDVGGFGGDVNAQMLVRYMQLGLFSPMFRNHSAIGTKRQEPWEFGKNVENILRSIIEYRYRLIPYIYTQYMVGLMKNVPLVRPMVYDFKTVEALSIEDQFMFGEAIVVAPVYRPDVQKRLVWLPNKAINIFDGKIYKKGWNVVDTPIEYVPAFQLINTAIPTAQPQQFVDFEKIDKIVWNVFLGKRAKTWFYEDDGVSLNYKKGIYNLKKIVVSDRYVEIQTVKNAYETRKRLWEFRIIDKSGEMKTKHIEVGSDGKYTIQI